MLEMYSQAVSIFRLFCEYRDQCCLVGLCVYAAAVQCPKNDCRSKVRCLVTVNRTFDLGSVFKMLPKMHILLTL